MSTSKISYDELRKRQQAEMNAFPLKAAFSNEQFKEAMESWGLKETDTDKIVSLGFGCFCLKTDAPKYIEMRKRHKEAFRSAIAEDTTGDGFIYQAFLSALNDHEYGYTGDADDAVASLGFTYEQISNDKALLHGFGKAIEKIKCA